MDKTSDHILNQFKNDYLKLTSREDKLIKITEILSLQIIKYYDESLEIIQNQLMKLVKEWQTQKNPFYVNYFFKKIIEINRKRLSKELDTKINEIKMIILNDNELFMSDLSKDIDVNCILNALNNKLIEMNKFYENTILILKKKFDEILEERYENVEKVEFPLTDFQSDTELMAKNMTKYKVTSNIVDFYSDSELDKLLVDYSMFSLEDTIQDDDTQLIPLTPQTNETSLSTSIIDEESKNQFAIPNTATNTNGRPSSPLIKVTRPKIRLGMKVYALRNENIFQWELATLIRTKEKNAQTTYCVRFNKNKNFNEVSSDTDDESNDENDIVELSSNCIAYSDKFDELPMKSRVVALYRNGNESRSPYYSSGIIAEIPRAKNRNRYMIMFDDGYAQYTRQTDVYLIFDQTWPEDKLHSDHVKFLQQYFSKLPERAMVKLEKSHVLMACYSNNWLACRVIDVDCSLVKLFFEETRHFEWIYRGSFRLLPFYEQQNKLTQRLNDSNNLATIRHRNELTYLSPNASTMYPLVKKQTARKTQNSAISLSNNGNNRLSANNDQQVNAQTLLNNNKHLSQGTYRLVDLQELARNEIIEFKSHPCTSACVSQWNKLKVNINKKNENILLIPVLLGWQRHVRTQSKESNNRLKRDVHYMAPCGRMLRTISEVDSYLNRTNCNLTIDMFTFDPQLRVDREYVPNANAYLNITDISEGKEDMTISCINCVDSDKPAAIQYSKNRIPLEGVPLNTDENLLDGCDCIDGCRDKLKCSCWRKTYEATTFIDCRQINTNVGYKYRRLNEVVNTGIFECNPKCKCDYRCNNRVVQNGISARLQLFKTPNKGWGLRALDDIAKGSFICIYTGHLMTEEQSDLRGQELGDEYFAELDFIECVRRLKQSIRNNNSSNNDSEDSDEFYAQQNMNKTIQSNSSTITTKQIEYIYLSDDDDDDVNDDTHSQTTQESAHHSSSAATYIQNYSSHTIQINSSEVFTNNSKPKNRKKDKKLAVRNNAQMDILASNRFFTNKNNSFYYKNYILRDINEVYIMDAKICGNIGRYFNHSCSPNIFVQNVFVDTYDLRFPWIAFFASQFIRAGQELCWDYNYTIDSVKGRKLFCHCGSALCRRRLL